MNESGLFEGLLRGLWVGWRAQTRLKGRAGTDSQALALRIGAVARLSSALEQLFERFGGRRGALPPLRRGLRSNSQPL